MQLNSGYRLLNKIKNVFLTLTHMIFLLALVRLEASDFETQQRSKGLGLIIYVYIWLHLSNPNPQDIFCGNGRTRQKLLHYLLISIVQCGFNVVVFLSQFSIQLSSLFVAAEIRGAIWYNPLKDMWWELILHSNNHFESWNIWAILYAWNELFMYKS